MSHKVSIPLAVLVVAGLTTLWYFTPTPPEYAIELNGTKGEIIAFGDSLIEGYGATKGNDFVSILSKNIGVDIVNAGIHGNTTEDALRRLDHDVLSLKPKIVIILLGGNDYLRFVSEEETFSNLETIIDRVREEGAQVVLLGIRVGIFKDPYKEDFERLADTRNITYLPNILSGIIEDRELMSDLIHPNDKGYQKMAERIEPTLEELIKNND